MIEQLQLDPEMIREFLSECKESMDELERNLVGWDKQTLSREALNQILRSFHTLKGSSGLFGFDRLQSIAHQSESVLCGIKEGRLAANTETVTTFLKVLDAVRMLLKEIELNGEEGEADYEVLVAELNLKTLQKQIVSEAESQVQPMEDEMATYAATDGTIRVRVALLDHLMGLAGGLVLERDHINRISVTKNDLPLADISKRLSHIILEFQSDLIKARLQPIGSLWNKYPRLIRDATLASGKKIRLEMTGDDMEIDRSIIEAVSDPLTHLIRNCIDHGIETPEARRAAGKPEEGCIALRAFGRDGHVIIEIEDDGAGIKVALIKEMALQRALITPTQAETMSDRDLQNLIFLPGFSTAPRLTKLSGRGMGMNVVKTNLDRIHGAVEVISRPGKGTLFKMKILQVTPLTLIKPAS
jgi:two-component system chemotaxis sensor kinase CheA